MWFWLLACSPEVVTVLEADEARTGDDGEAGPYGVERTVLHAQARLDDQVRYEVHWPVGDGGSPLADGPFPVVAFVHGGAVPLERYRWMPEHWASRGYLVIAADHLYDLAIFTSDNSSWALDDVLERSEEPGDLLYGATEPGDAAILGHSLGGVVAAFRWTEDERFTSVGILASYPENGTPVEQMSGRSLSVVGSQDESAWPEPCYEGAQRLPEPSTFAVIDGMNHYWWADDVSEAELAKDGEQTVPVEETRLTAHQLMDSLLDASLRDDADAAERLDTLDFDGVEATP